MTRLFRLASISSVALLVIAIGLAVPRPVSADPNPKAALITLAPVTGTRNVEMSAQIFDVSVAESGDNTILSGQLTFKLHNTDKLSATQAIVGFPFWGGGQTEFNEQSFTQFAVSLDGVPAPLQPQMQNLRIGNETRNVRWLTFPLTITEDGRATIEVKFRQDLGDAILPSVVIAQAPAINWKNYVGSARFTIRFPALTTPEQFRLQTPAGGVFDGKALTWLYSEYNPDPPIVLQLVRPRLWRELVQARAALAQGNDAKSALALGAQFTLLARATKLDADFAQAVAAYQRIEEGDALAPAAALEAARLYELRLRGDLGAVTDATGARTAALQQWQKAFRLNPGNAEARDAVGAHAFTLAQGLRRRGQFAGALAFLETARTANSPRASRAQVDSEMRAANAGLIAQRMDAGRWEDALQQIQSEAVGPEAKADRAAFQPRFVGLLLSTSIAGDRQIVVARLMPFPSASAAHQQLLAEWLARARRAGADGELAPDGGGYALTLRLALRPLAAEDLPEAPELILLRESLISAQIMVTRTQGLFSADESLQAQYSFVESQRAALARAAEIERAIAGLSLSAPDETAELVRAVRVRALEQYRTGWQSLATTASARITWWPGGAEPETWDVRVGERRARESRQTTYDYPVIIGASCLAIGGIGLILSGAWLLLQRRRRPAS